VLHDVELVEDEFIKAARTSKPGIVGLSAAFSCLGTPVRMRGLLK
jgi:hypothetical protein